MTLPQTIASPLLGDKAVARLKYTVESSSFIADYAQKLGMDVTEYFAGTPRMGVYQCDATGLKFYYPYGISGSADFYAALDEKVSGYYDDTKWEHSLVADWVKPGERVLDVGCGRGAFLAKAIKRGAIATGLESNKVAAAEAQARGAEIVDAFVEPHAQDRPGYYDMVATFQVLEHISDPLPYLQGCRDALKPGGQLVIAVPNDDGFLGMDKTAILNAPPHHLSLWNAQSLTALADVLGLTLLRLDVEPLNHVAWAQGAIEAAYVPEGWRRKIWHRLGFAQVLTRYLEENRKGIAGHSIVATYRKD